MWCWSLLNYLCYLYYLFFACSFSLKMGVQTLPFMDISVTLVQQLVYQSDRGMEAHITQITYKFEKDNDLNHTLNVWFNLINQYKNMLNPLHPVTQSIITINCTDSNLLFLLITFVHIIANKLSALCTCPSICYSSRSWKELYNIVI